MVDWFDIAILSVVEGITEFLPVSSTGHMIIAKDLLKLENTPQLDAFLIIVQAGAILAVVSVFFPLFTKWVKAWAALLGLGQKSAEHIQYRQQSLFVCASVIPFAIVGLLNKDFIKSLFSVGVVSYSLIVGGVLILFDEYVLSKKMGPERQTVDFGFMDAVVVGIGQCLALWPGFSRSAATIVFGRFRRFSRSASAEISFLVGLPTLLGTAGYETLKEYEHLNAEWAGFLIAGILISWVVAYICVRSFVAFLKRFPLTIFAYYRILVGVVLLWYFRNLPS